MTILEPDVEPDIAAEPSVDDPHAPIADIAAEQAVLGAVLISAGARDDVEHLLTAEDFYRPVHETIWSTVMRLHSAGTPADIVAVSAALVEAGEFVRVGGGGYLHTLEQSVPSAGNAAYYARIVAERAVQRRTEEAAVRIQHLARARTKPEALAGLAAAELEQSLASAATDLGRDMSEGWDDWIDQLDQVIPPEAEGTTWGWRDADYGMGNGQQILKPMQPGQLILIGARPSTGKSLVSRQIAVHALRQGKRVLLVSMEMSEDEVRAGMLACECKVPLTRIQTHTLSQDEWHRVARFRDYFDQPGLVIIDDQHVTLTRIRAAVRKHKADLVVIDHTGLIELPPHRPSETRHVLEDLSRGLKVLATDEACTVLACQQLSRESERRADPRPKMSDLRETGTWEQDAAVVILLFREDMHEPETPRAGELDLIVAKQRGGEAGFTISLAFQGAVQRAADMAFR